MTSVPTDGDEFLFDDQATGSESVITDLKPTKRDPSRMMIRVNRRVVATLPIPILGSLSIERGMVWTERLAEQVLEAVEWDQAYRKAMRLLERRAYSKGEIVDRLVRKEIKRATAECLVEELEEKGFLNDEEYGRAVLRQLVGSRPAGPRLMRQRLMLKKIDKGLADRLVAEACEEIDPFEDMQRLAEKRETSWARLDPAARKRRLYSLLIRRGFEPSAVADFMRRYADRCDVDDGE